MPGRFPRGPPSAIGFLKELGPGIRNIIAGEDDDGSSIGAFSIISPTWRMSTALLTLAHDTGWTYRTVRDEKSLAKIYKAIPKAAHAAIEADDDAKASKLLYDEALRLRKKGE